MAHFVTSRGEEEKLSPPRYVPYFYDRPYHYVAEGELYQALKGDEQSPAYITIEGNFLGGLCYWNDSGHLPARLASQGGKKMQ